MTGSDLRKLRQDHSLTAAAIGEKMGISAAGVFNIEARQRPYHRTVERYCAAVDKLSAEAAAQLVARRADQLAETHEKLLEALP
jgi:transcriptional regulator with XRE-family HTH domain